MGFRQFVAFVAALMALNALAIDSMLPAFPQIGESLRVSSANQTQWVITAYLLGFGVAQLVYGTLADRYGRVPVLLTGIAIYTFASVIAAFSTSFEMMMAARVLQGVGGAATRVLSISIVRDCYSGRQMARVMSLSFIVFLAVPILAPSIGQIIMLVGPWTWIFGGLALFGAVLLAWAMLRLPETLRPQDRTPISLPNVAHAFKAVLTSRHSIGYTVAITLVMGALFGFINSAQQVFSVTFAAPHLFTTIFAAVVAFMALSALVNASLVERLGMRRISHAALLGFIAFATLHLVLASLGRENIWVFAVLQAGLMFCFGIVATNFNAMAMEPVGHVAGTASSVQGFISMVGGALLGFFVGQHFDGTTIPMAIGFSLFGVGALIAVLITERGRLFQPVHESKARSKDSAV